MTQTIAYLSYSTGICSEALLAALIHVGLAPGALNTMLAAFPVEDGQCVVEPVKSQGHSGYRLRLEYTPPGQPLYAFEQAAKLLETASLTVRAQATTLLILQSVFEAEATVQGKPVEMLQLPSTYVMDVLLYGAGIVIGLESLQISQLYMPPLPLPTMDVGSVPADCAHPSQVALEICRRASVPLKPGIDAATPITPGTAAIVAALARFDAPVMTIERTGYGFCTPHDSSYSHRIHLGIYVGQAHVSSYVVSSNEAETDWVACIETHIDTMSGELLGGLMERLFAAGALDVSYTPIQMKKNRPATKITVICSPDEGERLALLLLRETSTLGVRIQHIQRLKAQRFQQQINTPLGSAVVKVKRLGDQIVSVAPEYEECRRIAQERHLPLADVYAIVREAARRAIIGQDE
jgi:pyridinium-3,5-bisthiocarboxylic acid mononucleotide nickel chelatase